MIKTVPFDIPLSFMVGMVVPLLCREGITAARHTALNRYFLGVVLFELFFFIPLGAYLYFFYPDWSLGYFVDTSMMQVDTLKAVGISALVSYMAAAVGGFWLSAWLIRVDRVRLAWLVLILTTSGLFLFSLMTLRQLTLIGTYAEWAALPRISVPIYLHRAGYIIAVDGLFAGIMLLLMIREFRRSGT